MADMIRFSEHLIEDGFAYCYAISAVDLTGNGSLDLVVPDTNVGLYWFENDGNGSFTRHTIQNRVGQWLERHAVADINGDGKPEIVFVDNINGCLLYFAYEGDPRDSSSWSYRYITEGELPGAYDVTVADLTGNGSLDVAASDWRIGNSFAWFENHGESWNKHVIEEGADESRTIEAADFNGDGRPDLLAGARVGGEIIWYKNLGGEGDDLWEKHVIDTAPGPWHGHAVDMDGDGDLDVVITLWDFDPSLVVGSSPRIAGHRESGGKGLNQVVWYENDGSPEAGPWKKHIIADNFPMAFEAVAADIDGDGQVEVVVTAGSNKEGRVVVFKHDGDPRGPWRSQVLKEGWPNVRQVILADLTGNSLLDIVASAERGSNELRWWRNEGPA